MNIFRLKSCSQVLRIVYSAALVILLIGPVFAQSEKRAYRPDRLIIFPKRGSDSTELQRMHLRAGRRILHSYRALGDLQVVQLAPGEKLSEAALHYKSSGLAEFVEPDYKLHASAITPNDPEFVGGTQWSLRNGATPGHDIGAALGWETLNSASNVVVAIVDSGVRYTHEDLAANIWTNPREIEANGLDDDNNGIIDDIHGINAINSTGDVMDDAGHGTHVAGIIGAVGNNRVGITGIAWKVQLMACKFLDSAGDGDTSDAIQCIDYARRNGANIINASWGGADFSSALNTAIANARAAGIIVVTAAGNDSENIDNVPLYPACFTLDNIVVVAGTSRADTLDTSYSNYGPINVDLCAPGTGIYSTWNSWDGAYSYLSGTSMAVPHVTGVLALMKARFPGMTYSQLISRLYGTVDVLPALAGKCKTGGRVNLARALGTDPTANFAASPLSGEPPLTVTFTNLTLGTLKSVSWDFGDGTPGSVVGDPTHVFASAGEFNVRLTVVGTNNKTNTFEQKIQVTSNYEAMPQAFAWIEPTAMDPLNLADNAVSSAIALPFEFQFYGEKYSSLYVGANGVIGFVANGLTTTDNTTLPTSGLPNALICPYWDNLNPAAGGSIYAGVVGVEPARQFVVSWVNVPRNSSAVALTFQAILEEGSNDIIFQYLETHPESTRGGAKRATIGVENSGGTVGALYTYNGVPHVLTNQSALRVKKHDYQYLVAKTDAVHLRAVFGYPATNVVGAIRVSNPGSLPLDWTVASSEGWLELPETKGTLAPGATYSIPVLLTASAESFAVGSYSGTVTLKNTAEDHGNYSVSIDLEVEQPRSVLILPQNAAVAFAGGLGGPFNPSSAWVQLQNVGNIPVSWNGSTDAGWLLLSPPSGILAPGQTCSVELTPGTEAQQLPSGVTTALVRFANSADPGNSPQQAVQLEVRSRVEQASVAVVVDGLFQGQLAVPVGNQYQVEVSDDLVTWAPLDSSGVLSGTILKFEDPLNAERQRFYRVRAD